MVRSARILLLLAAVGAAMTTTARAQAPATAEDRTPAVLPAPQPLSLGPTASGQPPTPTFAPVDLPGPYFERDALLDRPPLPQPGWFSDLDVGAVIPHLKTKFNGPVQLGFVGPVAGITAPNPDTVALPSSSLDWTICPRIEAGYRLPSGFGAISLSYRFLGTEGNGSAAGLDGPAVLHTRLDLNEIGLDYTSSETSLWPNWDMKWAAGVRALFVYHDSRADESPALAAAGSTVFEQAASDQYTGVGPHFGLELDRQLTDTGLSFVLRGDFAIYVGRLKQHFSEASTLLNADGTPLIGETREQVSQGVTTLGTFIGFRWQPPQWKDAEFYLGYQYEHWWDITKNNETVSSGELNVQGIVVRAGWSF